VITILKDAEHRVIAVQLPLHNLADDVKTVKRAVELIGEPTILAGHSYGGEVITNTAFLSGVSIRKLVGINKDKIRKFFQSHVDRSGYTLEVIVTRSLPGYSIKSEVPYIDKDESKGRYTDLIATRLIPPLEMFGDRTVDG
jgi:pimeloyl-ACP methyl ester carboxylesterase